MKNMHRAVIALTLLAMAGRARAADFFFMQMSDPQFGMFANDANFTQETANFEFAVSTINRLHPAFAIVCGDLVNKGGDEAQIAEYLRIAKKVDAAIPLYPVAGNHDVGNTPTPQSLALYRAKIGRDYYTFRQAEMEGIVLNSSLIQHPEGAADEAAKQERWLQEQLSEAAQAGRTIIVFQHIPYFLKVADEADQYFNIPTETRKRYLALLSKYGVRYVFAGHLHQNSEGTGGALQMITTGAVGKPLGDAVSGLRIVLVSGKTLDQKFYSLADLPNQFPPPKANQ
jgi:serine/threonine-protein phosphatase CPPED1